MKRFDRAIKVIQDEAFRVTGKVATDLCNKGQDGRISVRGAMVKNLNEAIKILQEHIRNVHV